MRDEGEGILGKGGAYGMFFLDVEFEVYCSGTSSCDAELQMMSE